MAGRDRGDTMRQVLEIHIQAEHVDGRLRYRAELWVKPFSGYLVACTRWCSTRQWAVRCAHVFDTRAKL